jgi:hypothetical protein
VPGGIAIFVGAGEGGGDMGVGVAVGGGEALLMVVGKAAVRA